MFSFILPAVLGRPLFGMTFIAFTQVIFFVNLFDSLARGKVAAAGPWQSNTLERTVSSPRPHGIHKIPTVYRRPYEFRSPLGSNGLAAARSARPWAETSRGQRDSSGGGQLRFRLNGRSG